MEKNYPNDNQSFDQSTLNMLAFKELYHTNFKQVYFFVTRFSLRSEDTEEIVQDVFLKFWENKIVVDPERKVSNLLFTIAQNLVIDKIRKYATEKKKMDFIKEGVVLSTSKESAEQLLNFYELSGIITKLIDELPVKRRAIFKLSREKGFTYKEIAETLNISQGTVEKQMSKALQILTIRLKKQYGIQVNL